MWKVVRSIVAVIAGFVAASAVMMLTETVNGRVLYPELGKLAEGTADKDAIGALLASAPIGAFLVVLLGWVLGWFWILSLLVLLPAASTGARLAPRRTQART